jgi:replicative DNA helicase
MELDRLTAGWQKGDLIIIAARPGMGKTAFVLSLARNAAVRFKRPVAFFSLEMSSIQLVNRLISAETELNHDKIRKGQLMNHEWQQLYSKITPLTQSPIYIDDVPALSIFELRAKCRRLVAEHGIQLIIVDYLQLMTSGSEKRNSNREQEISSISHSLKSIAKELKVPVIAISQLSRDVEKRQATNKRPLLSDLRESGAIEQDADLVLFIYREEYYFQEDPDPETKNAAEIIVAKNRNGTIGSIDLRFIGHLTKFVEPGSASFEGQPELALSADSDRITIRSKMDDEQGEPLPF